jgi:hypothetical protein
MNIQFNTDRNINGDEEFTAPYLTQIEDELSRYSDQITRIEIHLSDEDGNKNYYNELEVEWMSKDAAMQLAMKHFGLLQPEINVMVVSDEIKNRILIELLQQTAPTPDKISIVDGTVIDRLVNEL